MRFSPLEALALRGGLLLPLLPPLSAGFAGWQAQSLMRAHQVVITVLPGYGRLVHKSFEEASVLRTKRPLNRRAVRLLRPTWAVLLPSRVIS